MSPEFSVTKLTKRDSSCKRYALDTQLARSFDGNLARMVVSVVVNTLGKIVVQYDSVIGSDTYPKESQSLRRFGAPRHTDSVRCDTP